MKTGKSNILIVDDEPRNIKLLEAFIHPLGIETYCAQTGKLALEIIEKNSIDAILLDINMPGLNGIDLCKILKEDKDTRMIPVIFVTAYNDVDNHANAIEAGGIGIITKPIQKVLLIASLKNALRMKSLADEVEDLHRQRQNIFDMIVHDINNLLTLIISSVYNMLSNSELPQSINSEVKEIEKAVVDLRNMTLAMLYVEKLESGEMTVIPEKVNLCNLIQQRLNKFHNLANDRGINLIIKIPAEDCFLNTDCDLLSRVFDNLISNALKFCYKDGSVVIEVYKKDDNKLSFSISNDGDSIPSKYHKLIFGKYSQLEVSQVTGRKGVGLGLTFCKMAVEAMGGTISIESPIPGENSGVRFVINF